MSKLVLRAKTTKLIIYKKRKTVKAVILNTQNNKILLLSNLLIGGGVKNAETYEVALKREIIEESGAIVNIINYLGKVIQYRDYLQLRYDINGYLCTYINTTSKPTTKDIYEQNAKLEWKTFKEAISYLESEIAILLEKNNKNISTEFYQARLYNRQTTLFFLTEVLKKIPYFPKV
jgi:8-oxo-dGTP diphosphatase